MTCENCLGKRYLLSVRDDGRLAVERCDTCSWFGRNDPRSLLDTQAAALARRDGIKCRDRYPCTVYSINGVAVAQGDHRAGRKARAPSEARQ